MTEPRIDFPIEKAGTDLTNDERDFLLRGHDYFHEGFAEDPEQMQALWEAHREELLARWRAPKGNFPDDPLQWCEHGPHLNCWAEKYFD